MPNSDPRQAPSPAYARWASAALGIPLVVAAATCQLFAVHAAMRAMGGGAGFSG